MVHFGPSLLSCAQIFFPRGTMRVFEIARGPSTVPRWFPRKANMVDDLKQWARKEISKLLGDDVGQEFSE